MRRRFFAPALVTAAVFLFAMSAVAAPPAAHASDKITAPPPMPQDASPSSTKRGATTERWKGEHPKALFHVGGLTGAGLLADDVGYSVLGVAAVRMMNKGFIEDFTNQVFLEAQLGGLFITGQTYFQWALQLRWDFVLDEYWTFYAVGGLGGLSGNNRAHIYPRFGIGAQWNLFVICGIRAEITRDFIGAGLIFPL